MTKVVKNIRKNLGFSPSKGLQNAFFRDRIRGTETLRPLDGAPKRRWIDGAKKRRADARFVAVGRLFGGIPRARGEGMDRFFGRLRLWCVAGVALLLAGRLQFSL